MNETFTIRVSLSPSAETRNGGFTQTIKERKKPLCSRGAP